MHRLFCCGAQALERRPQQLWHTLKSLSCVRLCDPMDCSPPGSSIHGILQGRILEWVAISFPRGCSQPRDRTQFSCIAGRCFNLWATREALSECSVNWTDCICLQVSAEGDLESHPDDQKVKVAQSSPNLCNPMDYILHDRLLEWVAFPFSRGCSQPRDRTHISCTAGGLFTNWAIREAQTEV